LAKKRGDTVLVNIIISVALIVAVFASVAAWLNTQIILKDLAVIKKQLGIEDVRKTSVFDDDLDMD
jgi:hypothetical protein